MGMQSSGGCNWLYAALLVNAFLIIFFTYREVYKGDCRDCREVEKIIQEPYQSSFPAVIPGASVLGKHEGKKPRPLLGFMTYEPELRDRLDALIKRKASALDSELVSFVKEVMDEPASRDHIKMSRILVKTPQAIVIDELLNNKSNGFFIEAGANDGERSSNTIWFEKERGWTGLLVEPDPYFYTQLMGKNRHSWSINACVSPFDYVSEACCRVSVHEPPLVQIAFKQSHGGSGQLDMTKGASQPFKVPCFPLHTMLAALSVSNVDFFSLDVEGVEGIILESIPFDKLNISTLSVEYRHGDKNRYLEIMEERGFDMAKDVVKHDQANTLWVDDFIFIKKSLKKTS